MREFTVRTGGRTCFVDITAQVGAAVAGLGLADGAVLVFVPHTTAAVTLNEGADPDVVRDLDMELGKIVPLADGYRHAEGNSAAHLKSSLVGCSEIVPVADGRLALGTWQAVWFCEFDGPRQRRVLVVPL
ncbi:MAG: secondary thiamine-phosphate synthase enzyme YjbQ [Candidatus Krumholzibacteriia bacterium]